MGDHRAHITIDFEMHGHKAHYDFGYANWSDNNSGIDQRIVEWFAQQVETAMTRYHDKMRKAYEEQHRAEIEAQERAELKRLQEKYG